MLQSLSGPKPRIKAVRAIPVRQLTLLMLPKARPMKGKCIANCERLVARSAAP